MSRGQSRWDEETRLALADEGYPPYAEAYVPAERYMMEKEGLLVDRAGIGERLVRMSGTYSLYNEFSRASKAQMFTVVITTIGFFAVVGLLWLSFDWTAIDGVQAYAPWQLRDGDTICPAGTEAEGGGACAVRRLAGTSLDPAIFNRSADPCHSLAAYAAGGYAGEGPLASRAFGSAAVHRLAADREVARRSALQYSAAEVHEMAGRGGTGQFHDFVLSCMEEGRASAETDLAFVRQALERLQPNEVQGRADGWRGAYALGAAAVWNIEPALALDASVSPVKVGESLVQWDVGGMIRQYALMGDEQAGRFLARACQALDYLGYVDHAIYASAGDAAEDALRIFKGLVRLATQTEGDAHPMDAEYILSYMEAHDLHEAAALQELLGGDFVGGFLAGARSGFDPYRAFLREHGYGVPELGEMRQWVRRLTFATGVRATFEGEGLVRTLNYVRAMLMVDAMQFTNVVISAYGPDSTDYGEQPHPEDGASAPLQAGELPAHLGWLPRRPDVGSDSLGHPLAPHHAGNRARFADGWKPMWRQRRHEPGAAMGNLARAAEHADRQAARRAEASLDPVARPTLTDMMQSELMDECMYLATEALPEYHDRAYAATVMGRAERGAVRDLVHAVRDELARGVAESALPGPLRKHVAEKLASMGVTVGAPDFREGEELPYRVRRGASLLENVWATRTRDRAQALWSSARLDGTPNSRRHRPRLAMPTGTANAYYAPWENHFYILAGVASAPFFDPAWPAPERYAVLGAVVGHEMAHGFDPTGVLFDRDGVLRGDVLGGAPAAYDAFTGALERDYAAARTVPGNTTVDAAACITEIAADVLGAQAALDALVRAHPQATDDDFRAFVFAYVQLWATHRSPAEEAAMAEGDPHPPAAARQDGTVRHLRDPRAASALPDGSRPLLVHSLFHCAATDRMVPAEPAVL